MKRFISLFLCFFLITYNCFGSVSINGFSVVVDNTWHRKSITITGSTDGALTDYPISITVNHGGGVDTGTNVYLGGKARSDFGDIRFTSSDGTALKYWMEYSSPANKAIFWVKIPSLPASPATTTIYIYYNNGAKVNIGDGHDVFTSFLDATDSESFNSNKRWLTVQQPYHLDPAVNVDVGGANAGQWYGNPSSAVLSNGNYVMQYHKYNGTSYDNSGVVEQQVSTDRGKTWGGRQIVYDDPTPYNAEIAGLFEIDSTHLMTLIKLINRPSDALIGIKYAISTNGGTTWPDEASFLDAYGPSAYIHGIPDDWVKIGTSWYAMSENVGAGGDSYSALLKYDGTNFSIVSTTPVTPYSTTEAAVTPLGGNKLRVISRHRDTGEVFLDASTRTIQVDSNDMGATWGSQIDIADKVGILQDPNLMWISGTNGIGPLMLYGRQGPNIGTAPDLTQQDNIAWFSYDGGNTWKNKTVLFTNSQTASATVGGYVTSMVDPEFLTLGCWTDYFTPNVLTIGVKRLYKNWLEDTLELHAYAQSNDTLADAPFSNNNLTHYSIEVRSKAYATPQSDITSLIFEDGVGQSKKVAQIYIPRTASDIGYLNGATSSSATVYAGFSFNTKYVVKIDVDTTQPSPLKSIKALNEDRSLTLGTVTNKAYSQGAPTKIDNVEIGTDFTGGRAFSHIDFIMLRKLTDNEPVIASYGAEEDVSSYPV